MRLTVQHIEAIRNIVREEGGADVSIRLFGSRLDDSARGGDIDLLLQTSRPVQDPALLSARVSARLMRALGGRRVDVVLSAPNLKTLPIHRNALIEGVLL
ncbi:MAG: nucleotidyltransferase domain-containing protein [Sulfuritalea sp.]|nr:nucleotidyltransferase domain-containing protein [Sulfuritalea sp.]MDP1984606.1 nucleotidyltransferase domain-containing protein [Sulfuritalea sp.]